MRPIVCLVGPTAAGKTQLAVQLVQQFAFEIISVDSAMVYRGMDIGTAKPDASLLKIAPHHLINIRDPAETYSAAQFREDALREINQIFARNKIPLLVGGTMLYFRALQKGLSAMPSADADIREILRREGEKKGWPVLHQRLQKIDSVAAERIHPHDSQRIQRALEVFELTGKTISDWQRNTDCLPLDYAFYFLAIAPRDRSILHHRIAQRFEKMLEEGLLEEARALYDRGDLNLDTPAIRSVGYRQIWQYFQDQITFDAMREKSIIATRQFAKRQLTWLRNWPHLTWFDSESKTLFKEVSEYLRLQQIGGE